MKMSTLARSVTFPTCNRRRPTLLCVRPPTLSSHWSWFSPMSPSNITGQYLRADPAHRMCEPAQTHVLYSAFLLWDSLTQRGPNLYCVATHDGARSASSVPLPPVFKNSLYNTQIAWEWRPILIRASALSPHLLYVKRTVGEDVTAGVVD
jgi:hypothetical protein